MFFAIAVVTLALVLLFNVFCSVPLQTAFGFWGAAATELGYALIALAGSACMILAARRKQLDGVDGIEIFSTRPPEPKAILGGLLLLGASYFAAILYTNIVNLLFPEAVSNTVQGLQSIFDGVSLPALLLCLAVIPAICEEMVFRGILQYALGRYGSPRVTILLTGVVFGLFHLDPVRIPIAAMTGIALSYALYRSRSIFVTMLMHFVNNAASAVLSYAAAGTQEEAAAQVAAQMEEFTAMGLPGWLLYAFSGAEITVIILGLLIAGLALLEAHPTEALKKHWVTAVVLCAVVLLLGAGFIVLSAVSL